MLRTILLIVVMLSAVGRVTQAAERPNIIFVLTDDQRFDTLGCMGNEIIKTPNIDELSAQGVTFDNMFCTTSICAISRATYLLGQYERRHKIDSFRTPYSKEQLENSFPLRLRAAGYRTGFIGKWGVGREMPETAFDYWRGFPGQSRYFNRKGEEDPDLHLTRKMEGQALEFLDGCGKEQPFLLQVYTKAAHCQDGDPWPFQPDQQYNNLYTETDIPLPPTADVEHFNLLPDFLKTSEARTRWHVRFENPELAQKSLKDYYRLITGVDDMVQKIREKLAEMGAADNTVIIYTSDNGFYLADRGLAGKWYAHEESIRLPLIIYDPRLPQVQRGTRRNEVVLNIDIAPTIFELAGETPSSKVQGRSLMSLVRGETVDDWRTDFLYEHRIDIKTIPKSEGVRTPRWKYVRYYEQEPVYEELFDLEADPLEEHDLAHILKHKDELQTMRDQFEELATASE